MRTTGAVRGRWIIALAVGLPLLAIALLSIGPHLYDGRKHIDLADWLDQDGETFPGARSATDEVCGEELPCIQAITSETLTMYRFEHRALAVAVAESFGDDGYQTGWIAVRYEPGGLTESQRHGFEYHLSCINTFVGDEGQAC